LSPHFTDHPVIHPETGTGCGLIRLERMLHRGPPENLSPLLCCKIYAMKLSWLVEKFQVCLNFALEKYITKGYIKSVRIFKNKWFNNWARKEKISDEILIETTNEIETGKVDANLGSFSFKKRLPKSGSGKSGGYRVLVAYKKGNQIFFLYAFAKNQRANISDKEKAALKLIAKSLMVATEKQLQALIKKGSICEVKNE